MNISRKLALSAIALALTVGAVGHGAPTKGGHALDEIRVEAGESWVLEESFRVNERACVIVEGDHRPVVDVKIQVFDDNDQLVAEDSDGGDIVAAIWYPTREAAHRIVVTHAGTEYNVFRIVVK